MRHGSRAYRSALRHLPGRLAPVLECVVNISEGRRVDLVEAIGAAAGPALLDVHSDPDHNRSVLTLVGEEAPRAVTFEAVARLDLRDSPGGPSPVRGRRRGAVRAAGGRRHRGGRGGSGRLRPVGGVDPRPALLPLRTRAHAPRRAPVGVSLAGSPTSVPANRIPRPARSRSVPGRCWSRTTCGSATPDLDVARDLARRLRSPAVRALAFPLGAPRPDLAQPRRAGRVRSGRGVRRRGGGVRGGARRARRADSCVGPSVGAGAPVDRVGSRG